nr:MAG TPA: hypothetical protein [Caudoviricetes sp.]
MSSFFACAKLCAKKNFNTYKIYREISEITVFFQTYNNVF